MTTIEVGLEVHGEAADGAWELLWVDPRSLVIGVNTRTDPELDRGFVASIRDRGVREPITVRRDGDQLVVRKGQRRTLAAVESGLDVVPVVVVPENGTDQTQREIERIVDQLGENQHRAGLPDGDEVAAHQQLLALGLTAGQVVRRTRSSAKRVRATTSVAGSDVAVEALRQYQLTVDQAAVIADFDDDPEQVQALVAAARTGLFEHVAQRARDAREEAALRDRLTAELAEAGVRVVDPPEGRARRDAVRALGELRAGAYGESGEELTAQAHAACPGHVAWLATSWRADRPLWIEYGCDGWREHGHAERYAQQGLAVSGSQVGKADGSWSEEQKAERRTVIANNKAWTSATRVRRNWLTQFLARKTAPKDAAAWIAMTLASGSHTIRRSMERGQQDACVLLGLQGKDGTFQYGQPHPVAVAAQAAGPARATILSLGLLLGALEAACDRNTWRQPTTEAVAYLQTLQRWGYQLSEVEQLALDSANSAICVRTNDDAGADEVAAE